MCIVLSHTWEKKKEEKIIIKFVTNLLRYCVWLYLLQKGRAEENHQSHRYGQWHTDFHQVGFRLLFLCLIFITWESKSLKYGREP